MDITVNGKKVFVNIDLIVEWLQDDPNGSVIELVQAYIDGYDDDIYFAITDEQIGDIAVAVSERFDELS